MSQLSQRKPHKKKEPLEDEDVSKQDLKVSKAPVKAKSSDATEPTSELSPTLKPSKHHEEGPNTSVYYAVLLIAFGFLPGVIVAAVGVLAGVSTNAVSQLQVQHHQWLSGAYGQGPLQGLGSVVDATLQQQELQQQQPNTSLAVAEPAQEFVVELEKHFPGVDDYSSPKIVPVKNLFSAEECHNITKLVESIYDLYEGRFSENGRTNDNDDPTTKKAKSTRISKLAGLPKSDPRFRWLYDRVLGYALYLNEHHWKYQLPRFVESELVEHMQYAVYHGHEAGHYDWHQDSGVDGPTSLRKVSITVQLSPPNDYDGGELQLTTNWDEIIPHTKEQGSACFFQSTMLHRVAPVTAGIRRSLVLWLQTVD